MLLQILEEGRLTDNVGRVISFRNTIILLTSNVGADTIRRQTTMGFSPVSDEHSYEKMKEKIMEEAKRIFRPEFLNRLDDAIVFRSLTKPELVEILELEISKVVHRLKGRQLVLSLDDGARDFLLEKGYDPTYGARPMRRAVERNLEDPLAEEILRGGLQPNEPIMVSLQDGRLVFKQKASPAAPAEAQSS
jgi:ATP-dependent Clp protease ATP-binding subunit ClpC